MTRHILRWSLTTCDCFPGVGRGATETASAPLPQCQCRDNVNGESAVSRWQHCRLFQTFDDMMVILD